jgi:hypothetical protein
MAFITYKQADSRWGKKNYNGSSSMATAGCGPTSCAMIAYAVDGKTTPLDTMKYMQKHGYAVRNQGTKWAGIPACLKAFGVKDVQNVPNMAKCWELMKKGYVGIFLFRKGKRNGVTWTSSGHYIAVTDYKYQNGKHYVYTRDSGGRNHTGWYAYETTMKGLIPEIWLGKVIPLQPVKKPTGKYNGIIPAPILKLGSKGDGVKNLQKFLNWYHPSWKLKPDGIFGSGTERAVDEFQRAEGITPDGIYGKISQGKANAYKVLPQSNGPVAPAPSVKPAPKPTTPTRTKMSRIGHARKDYDHKAGDSSGKEVLKSKFTYSSSSGSVYNWTYVFRPKDISKANKAASMCEKAIANNNIGYCSNGETAYGKSKAMTKLAKAVKYDLSKITTKCGCSCGDLICLCNHYAGLSTCYIGSGKQLAEKYKKNSNFQTIKYKKSMQLYRGDVLITAHSSGKNNHVVMCL